MNVKQVIVVRKDLNMRKGKIASQVAHASIAAVLKPDNYVIDGELSDSYHFEDSFISNGVVENRRLVTHGVDDELKYWLENSFTKICVSVDSEKELLDIKSKCEDLKIRHSFIVDNGATEFSGVKTATCIAVGPANIDLVNQITGSLKLI